jgi:peptidoglycan/LPS O-acetylase OafA/YrhL
MIVGAVTAPAGARSPFSSEAAIWVGRRSYGIYLFHLPVFALLEGLREPGEAWNGAAVTVARVVATMGIAAASFKLVETPALRLKTRMGPKRNATEPAAGAAE